MGIAIFIILFVIFGAIIAKLAGIVGKKYFRFSDIYKCFIKLFKKSGDE